jgi:hypothetical protein
MPCEFRLLQLGGEAFSLDIPLYRITGTPTGTPKRQTENSAYFRDSGLETALLPAGGDAQDPRIWPLRTVCC